MRLPVSQFYRLFHYLLMKGWKNHAVKGLNFNMVKLQYVSFMSII